MTEQPVKLMGMMQPAGDKLTLNYVPKADQALMRLYFTFINSAGYEAQFNQAD